MALSTLWLAVVISFHFASSAHLVNHVAMALDNNYVIGATLDTLFQRKASPFSAESFAAFEKKWNEIRKKEPTSRGKFDFRSKVVDSQKEKLKALGVDVGLDVSYMKFSVCFTVALYPLL